MTAEFAELDEATRKVREWKREAKQSAPVVLASGVDLTMPLEDGPDVLPPLTSFEVLTTGDILTRLVHIPSITTTAAASGAFGAAMALLLTRHYSAAPPPPRGFVMRWARWLLRVVMAVTSSVLFLRFLRGRYPTVQRVSQYENLSRSADGPCFVANRILTLTSSQAGTHADGPHHFCRSLSHRNYDDAHYSGDAAVLDVSAELRQAQQTLAPDAPLAITVDFMERARAKLPAAYLDGSRPVWRLLLVTRSPVGPGGHGDVGGDGGPAAMLARPLGALFSADTPLQPLPSPLAQASGGTAPGVGAVAAAAPPPPAQAHAFLYPETVDYLHRVFPRLLLVGIDSPSVDAAGAMPPVNHSHGALLRCGMAILENLRFTSLYPLLQQNMGAVAGSMMTVFTATQSYDDARGCSVIFFPEEAALHC